MEHIVVLLVLLIVLFGTIEPKPIQDRPALVRHMSEYFDEDYFEGVEL